MCGIALIWGPSAADEIELAQSMLDAIRHRGSVVRFVSRPTCILGVTRLPVTDPAGGDQPMVDAAGTRAIAYNGEVYNHADLRERFLGGTPLRSRSDTEVVLELVARFGPEALATMNGMFAFAVHDSSDDSLFIARDRLGIKSLYFFEDRGRLYMASEIKALAGPAASRGRPILQILPGEYRMSAKAAGSFYRCVDIPLGSFTGNIEEAAAKVRQELSRSVRMRIARDVPTGLLLSGGVDSSVIAFELAQHYGRSSHIEAYTVGMEASMDFERAARVCSDLGLSHRTRFLTADDVRDVIPTIIRVLENYHYYAVMNAIPTYFAYEEAHRFGTTVLLSGEGSDEIFGGYDFFYDFYDPGDLPQTLRRAVAQLHRTELHRVDRISMAHTVEARVPFLDHHLVEFALGLRDEHRYQIEPETGRRLDKLVLRRAYDGALPREIVWREKDNFFRSSGIEDLVGTIAAEHVSQVDLERERSQTEWKLRTVAECHFFRIWRDLFPDLCTRGPAYFNGPPAQRLLNVGLNHLPD